MIIDSLVVTGENASQQRRAALQRWELACVLAALAAYSTLLVVLARQTGVTVDEPAHILSSILYWEGNDRLEPRDLPPLIKIAGGWLAAEAGFPIVEERHPVWKTNHEWNVALDMMNRMRADQVQRAMFLARLPMLVFPIATALLLWWWGRQLFRPGVGLLLMLLFMLEPTALGHAPLYKNDHASTFGLLFFAYRAWRFLERPSLWQAAGIGVGVLLAVMAKLSMLITLALAPVAVVARGRRLGSGRLALCLLLLYLIPYLGLIAAYQFDAKRLTTQDIRHARYVQHLRQPFLLPAQVSLFVPIPNGLWKGYSSLAASHRQDNGVYLLGRRYSQGHRAYFLIAMLVKVPEVILLLLVSGLVLLAKRAKQRQLQLEDLCWIAPGALYFFLASLASLQLGFRLVLPCLPFALMLCGHTLQLLNQGRRRLILATLFAILIVQVAGAFPHFISFFNWISGGPRNALHYLSDSNVDWGQDLRRLKQWAADNRIHRLCVAYFGLEDVYAYFSDKQVLPMDPPWQGRNPMKRRYQPPEPGIYALSANMLTGQFFSPEYRDYYRVFRDMEPVAYAGYSIYIFRVP